MELALLVLVVISIIIITMAVKIVPLQEAWVVETYGKFEVIYEGGNLFFLIPIIQRVAYKHKFENRPEPKNKKLGETVKLNDEEIELVKAAYELEKRNRK